MSKILYKKATPMLGAIAGDIIGSCFEWHSTKKTDFELFSHESHFTDDTILTVAVAYSILENIGYAESLKHFGNKYEAGYGASFHSWLESASFEPYNSWGNGSAMWVSPVAYAFNSVEGILTHAKKSAEVTHNHTEGIKGAQAVALVIFLRFPVKAQIQK
jgi:ADP-ribosylglycohydrolase